MHSVWSMLSRRLVVISPLEEVEKVESSSSTKADNKVVFYAPFSSPTNNVAGHKYAEAVGRDTRGECLVL